MRHSKASASLAQTADRRSVVYRLFARLWGREIDGDVFQKLTGPSLAQAMADAGISMDPDLLHVPIDSALERLAEEYTRLFIGPGPHISACESVYAPDEGEQPRLFSSRATATRRFILKLGLSYDEGYTGVLDSIDVQLDVMGKLVAEEAHRWSIEDAAGATKALVLERQFLDEPLARWVDPLCADVIRTARLEFYKSVAAATRDFVTMDGQYLCREGQS